MICEQVPGFYWRAEEFPEVLDIAWPVLVLVELCKFPTLTLAASFVMRGSCARGGIFALAFFKVAGTL